MIDVTTIYDPKHLSWIDYQPMLNAFGHITIQMNDYDYSGDSWILYRSRGMFGYLCFGWGSCSGCDALRACQTITEVQILCDRLESSIKWFASRAEALQWFSSHDWLGDWHYNKTFVDACINYLEND